MKLRDFDSNDLHRILELHEKHEFELPDLNDARMVVKKCLLDNRGKIRLAAFGRLQANAYLLVDGTWRTPEERYEAIQILEFAMISQAKIAGLDQVTAQVTPRFGRRLEPFGWKKSLHETWHKEF